MEGGPRKPEGDVHKILVIGDAGSGKSVLGTVFAHPEMREWAQGLTGSSYKPSTERVTTDDGINLSITDTEGAERYGGPNALKLNAIFGMVLRLSS